MCFCYSDSSSSSSSSFDLDFATSLEALYQLIGSKIEKGKLLEESDLDQYK